MKSLKYVIAIILILGLLETIGSFGIVGVAAMTGRDFKEVAKELHVSRLILSPLFARHPIETAVDAKFLGRLYDNADKLSEHDGLLGWRYAKGVSTYGILRDDMWAISEFRPGVKVLYPWIFTNAQGFRSAGETKFFYQRPKPKGVFRIIMLGGSTMAGDFAESHRDTLPARFKFLMEKLTAQHGLGAHDRLEVINAGVGGYDSTQEYMYLLTELWSYQPDLVIAYDGWNDWGGRYKRTNEENVGQRKFRTDVHNSLNVVLQQSTTVLGSLSIFAANFVAASIKFAKGFSPVYTVLKIIEHATYSAASNFQNLWPPTPETFLPFLKARADLLRDNIEREILWSRQYGTEFAAFLQPFYGVDNREYVGWEKRYNDQNLERAAHSREFYGYAREHYSKLREKYETAGSGVCIADISGYALRDVKARVYMDHGHLLGVGNEAVAKSMIKELDRCKLLPWQR